MPEDYDYESLGGNSTLTQDAMAGALAGIAEHCAMYPVDSIKTRMQVIHSVANPSITSTTATTATAAINNNNRGQIFNNGGTGSGSGGGGGGGGGGSKHHRHVHSSAVLETTDLKGFRTASRNLWRGVNSVVIGAGPAHAIHFATYEACKEAFGGNTGGHHLFTNAAAGACATLAHDTLMNPFDVIKQRMQLGDSTYRSIRECARHVYSKEGIAAFYISLPTTLTMSIPFQSIQFATYEFFRKVLNPQGEYDPKTHAIAGGLAGAFASSVTTPLDVVKTLLQTRGTNADPRIRNASGLMEAVHIIKERYGLRGFFRGFKPRILTNMPSAAISWSVYEYFKWFISSNNTNPAVNDNTILSL